MGKTKVTVKMEIEVEDIEDFSKFIATVEKGVIKFSEETRANVLKVEVKEHQFTTEGVNDMKAKILFLLLKNVCEFNGDKPIYVSVDNKLIPCTRISSHNDKIVIGTEKWEIKEND